MKIINELASKSSELGEDILGIGVAGAGIVSKNFIRLTNSSLIIRREPLLRFSRNVFLLNDACAFAIATKRRIRKKSLKRPVGKNQGNRVVITIGTGFGAAILTEKGVIASEAGHSILPAVDNEEMLIAKRFGFEIEDLISGRGIERIYEFYREKYGGQPLDAKGVCSSNNKASFKTRRAFSKLLGRVCRNLALTVMASGGVWIGGGVIANNPSLLGAEFIDEFVRSEHQAHRDFLLRVGVHIVLDEYAGAKGAIEPQQILSLFS